MPTYGARSLWTSAAAAYVGPGDIISGAQAWWGLRGYTATYSSGSNPAIDVVKASDGSSLTTINILATGALDAASITALGFPVAVTKIYDQTGNGNHLTQATLSQMPTLPPSVIGSFYAMAFVAASLQELALSGTLATPPSQPYTMVIAAKRNPRVTSTDYFFGARFNGCQFGGSADNVFISAGVNSAEVPATDGAFHAFQDIFNGASSSITVDGSTTGSLDAGTNAFSSSSVSFGGDTLGDNMSGNGLEYGIWPVAFSGGQLSSMNSNMRNYWGF